MSDPEDIWPGHAYVPGRSDRHVEGAFDTLRDTAAPGMSIEALFRSAAFRQGRRYYDAGFYWEAHEVWEPVWLALPEGTDERVLVQAMIQLANGWLKLRMNRPKAAARLAAIVESLLREVGDRTDRAELREWIETESQRLKASAESAL